MRFRIVGVRVVYSVSIGSCRPGQADGCRMRTQVRPHQCSPPVLEGVVLRLTLDTRPAHTRLTHTPLALPRPLAHSL